MFDERKIFFSDIFIFEILPVPPLTTGMSSTYDGEGAGAWHRFDRSHVRLFESAIVTFIILFLLPKSQDLNQIFLDILKISLPRRILY